MPTKRVVADDVDQRGPAAPRVVQVGQPVAQAGGQVQQRRRRPPGHPGVAVGGAGRDALEQRQDAAHLGDVVQRGDEVHLRGAGVGEADVDARADEGPDECLGAVHRETGTSATS